MQQKPMIRFLSWWFYQKMMCFFKHPFKRPFEKAKRRAGSMIIEKTAKGTTDVIFIATSESALSHIDDTLKLNQYEGSSTFMHGDAFAAMQFLIEERAHFDVLMIDPRAVIARRKGIKSGKGGYH